MGADKPMSSSITIQTPTAEEFESVLKRHVLNVWFPRSLDLQYGGFLCDFDYVWNSFGPQEKLLEFQARQTWLAAEASQAYPQNEYLRQATKHGFCYLRDVMWDSTSGGWFHRLDRIGRPLEAHTKHSHGIAYAISACVAVYKATGEPGALDLAREGFEWLDRYAHDDQYGGYFGFLRQDGTVIRDEKENPRRVATDTTNTPIGYKDVNVHSDLLETFTYLYRAWPSPKVAQRLTEIVNIICDRMSFPSGGHYHFCLADWTPAPHLTRFGYEFQSAFRLVGAMGLVENSQKIINIAHRFVEHALRYGWDHQSGGFFYAGPGVNPIRLEGQNLMVSTKPWWVQVEALKALLTLSHLEVENSKYLKYFNSQWSYIKRYLIDSRNGGFYTLGFDALPWWHRLRPIFVSPSFTRKGHVWKDGSHEGRALLHVISMLVANSRMTKTESE